MLKLPVVDVVLPNYNKSEYIGECLNSLKNQTFKDWRCIVVDGFSDDGSWEIIQDFANQDERFELYQLPRTGLYQSWNFGLSKVTSPYFCILTSDDVWDKNWLQLATQSITSNNNAICVAARTYSLNTESKLKGIAYYNQLGEKFFTTNDSTPQIRSGIIDSIAHYFIGTIYTSVHSLLLKSEILNLSGMFAEDLGNAADLEWSMKIGLYGDIIYHPEIKASWRTYKQQASQLTGSRELGKFIQKIHSQIRNRIAEKLDGFGDEFIAIAEEYDRHIIPYYLERPQLGNFLSSPLVELPSLLKVSCKRPNTFVMDCFFKMFGKRYFSETGLKKAQLAYRLYKSV